MFQPFPWIFQGYVDFPRDCLPVVEQKIFVLFSILCFVLHLFSRLGIIQNYVNFSTLSETEEAHPGTEILIVFNNWSDSTSIQFRSVHRLTLAALYSEMHVFYIGLFKTYLLIIHLVAFSLITAEGFFSCVQAQASEIILLPV